jgi:hypothetical protein
MLPIGTFSRGMRHGESGRHAYKGGAPHRKGLDGFLGRRYVGQIHVSFALGKLSLV